MLRSRGRRPAAHRRSAPPRAEPDAPPWSGRGSLRQLMVTPTFVFGVTLLTMATLAFGTTQTYLRFSAAGPDNGCGAARCARPDSSHARAWSRRHSDDYVRRHWIGERPRELPLRWGTLPHSRLTSLH